MEMDIGIGMKNRYTGDDCGMLPDGTITNFLYKMIIRGIH